MRCLATGFGWTGRAGVSPPNARCRARSSVVVFFAISCHLALRGVVAGAVRSAALLRSMERFRDCPDGLIALDTPLEVPQQLPAGDLSVLVRTLMSRLR